jgi:hypothetical protein
MFYLPMVVALVVSLRAQPLVLLAMLVQPLQ